MRRLLVVIALALAACRAHADSDTVRLKDLGRFAGARANALVGYGLVTGLAGTGDSASNQATRQSLANMLAQFDIALAPDQIHSRNSAAVMITATLPPFAAEGDTVDVTVTSMGDARSLVGGSLLLAPLKGPDNKVYALAQGAVSVGGYKYDLNGNVQQKNHPTVGMVPAGATIEVAARHKLLDANQRLVFKLADPDFTTAARAALAINASLGAAVARARDAEAVEIDAAGEWSRQLPELLVRLEKVMVEPDRVARVVVNERTGTVVAGGDVRIGRVALSHGDLKLSIVTDNTVSQPILVRQTGPDVRTESLANSRIDVSERAAGYVSATHNTVADLIQALVKMKTNTRDIIAILQAVKAAGAMRAELVIQ
jgi:flagellar P-ring protein precursor FlgI